MKSIIDKIRVESPFFDLFFSVYDSKVRKIFCLGKNDPEYNKIQKEFIKEIKSAIRKYKNKAKKYLMKKGENNADLQSKRKAHLSKEKPMDMEKQNKEMEKAKKYYLDKNS